MAKDAALTVRSYIHYLLGDAEGDTCPRWPPDAFAIAGALLQRSGAYRLVITQWPPGEWPPGEAKNWVDDIRAVAMTWRHAAAEDDDLPGEVLAWWNVLHEHADRPLEELGEEMTFAHALLQITAAADEASADVGIFLGPDDEFSRVAMRILQENKGKTLCQDIHPSRVAVLPKLHAPQSGLTMRSLTHHLSLYLGGQIRPRWHAIPTTAKLQKLLILPWPLRIDPKHFAISHGDPANMPPCYDYFTYDLTPGLRGFDVEKVIEAIKKADRQIGGRVDAVVFPELSLRSDEYLDIATKTDRIVIGGVGSPPTENKLATNSAAVAVPTPFGIPIPWKQSKHHRWRLDKAQIEQYEMAGRFEDLTKLYWEHIALEERELHFLTLQDSVTVAVLICEDLARLDPINELVATVGPTLVVALLMDGPQIAARWPGRYATVLADDPGSSVLSVTSLGMARLYNHPKFGRNSTFALWKDAKSNRGPVTIGMQHDDSIGAVLTLAARQYPEFTADGRDDFNETFYLEIEGDPVEIRP